ncbi:MAG: sigma-54-dependent Fis family transcriptional regulator [Pyrinomonadaceae bacterium]|nr:sigma-54-dependent Fis family transcriptional regulator [Pyrinomonadaceae bacterium]
MKKVALVIDDDVATLELMQYQLESKGFSVFTAENGKTGEKFVKENEFDIILTDLNLPDISGIEMVGICKGIAPETEIIMITGDGSATRAVEATKAGAFYYVEKPINFDELLVLIEKAIERKSQAAEIRELRGKLTSVDSYQGIIGGSSAMQDIYEIIENVAESDANILVLGESGTGKEVIANAIHYKSNRSKRPFVKVNCSALPKELIESQLFGHVKGAFTGANTNKLGLIGKAEGGSLLLDEIGEMPPELQPKLLRVLQEKSYYKVGSETAIDSDFRLISATNRDPLESIREGNLREDLYYRINTIEIRIPPLRQRSDDIPMLAEHFLEIYSDKYNKKNKSFSKTAYEQMLNYHWRGNVRELKHVIERAVLMTKKNEIGKLNIPDSAETNHLPGETNSVSRTPLSGEEKTGSESLGPGSTFAGSEEFSANDETEFFEKIGDIVIEKMPGIDKDNGKRKDVFSSLEYGVVKAALEKTNGNKRAAAKLLGLYRPRLYGMIKRHDIES